MSVRLEWKLTKHGVNSEVGAERHIPKGHSHGTVRALRTHWVFTHTSVATSAWHCFGVEKRGTSSENWSSGAWSSLSQSQPARGMRFSPVPDVALHKDSANTRRSSPLQTPCWGSLGGKGQESLLRSRGLLWVGGHHRELAQDSFKSLFCGAGTSPAPYLPPRQHSLKVFVTDLWNRDNHV